MRAVRDCTTWVLTSPRYQAATTVLPSRDMTTCEAETPLLPEGATVCLRDQFAMPLLISAVRARTDNQRLVHKTIALSPSPDTATEGEPANDGPMADRSCFGDHFATPSTILAVRDTTTRWPRFLHNQTATTVVPSAETTRSGEPPPLDERFWRGPAWDPRRGHRRRPHHGGGQQQGHPTSDHS